MLKTLIIVLLPFSVFCQSNSKTKGYLQAGLQLEGGKHFGGKINMGFAGRGKDGSRSFGAGLGFEVVSFSDSGASVTATPVYVDFRKYVNLEKLSLFISGNIGLYAYSQTLSYRINLGDGESVTSNAKTKGQAFAGINLGAIVPFKGKRYNGIYISFGYRNISFNTDVETKTVTKNRNGNGYSTITKKSSAGTNSNYLNASIGLSF